MKPQAYEARGTADESDVKFTFDVSLAGASVRIVADNDLVHHQLDAELGDFFSIDRSAPRPSPADALALAEISVATRKGEAPAWPGERILLHEGSHDYDGRYGDRWHLAAGRKIIRSERTGSLITAVPGPRRVLVENADPKQGATDVRRVVRDLLFIPWLESLGAVLVHGAAVVGAEGHAALVLGDRGAGKTTLFMSASEFGSRTAMSCERIIVLPTTDGLVAFACPENISIFPGTLRSFPSTADLAGPQGAEEWEREAKIRVPWRELFLRLGLDARRSAAVQRLVFPRWSSGASSLVALSPNETFQRLLPHVVTARDVNRPDWLGWFAPQHTDATIHQMAGLEAVAGTWTDNRYAYALMFGT